MSQPPPIPSVPEELRFWNIFHFAFAGCVIFMRVFLFWGVCMCVFVKTSLDVTSFPHVYIARRCSFVFQQQVHFLLAVQQTKKQKQIQNKTKQKNWNVEQKRAKVIFQSIANWIFYSFLTFHYVSNYNFFVSLLPYPISHVKGKIGFGFAQMVLDLLLQLLWLPYTILIVHRPSDRHYSFILTRPLPNIINTRVT